MPLEEQLHDPAALAHANGNGGTTHPDAEVIELLQAQVASRQVRIDELEIELHALQSESRRYAKALAYLTGETAGAKPGPKPKAKTGAGRPPGSGRPASKHGKISDRLLDDIKAAVLAYASDHDEFRQVDIRNYPGLDAGASKSSTMAIAFEALRQDSVIRMARVEGNNKFFRLTREALSEVNSGD
jgi:hypothetical protein